MTKKLQKKIKTAVRGIVFYIDVDNVPPGDLKQYMKESAKQLNCDNEIHYYIPVRGIQTHVELLWTK